MMDLFPFKGKSTDGLKDIFNYIQLDDEFIKNVFKLGGLEANVEVKYYENSIGLMVVDEDDYRYFSIRNDFEVFSGYNSQKYLLDISLLMQKGLTKIYGKKYVKACAFFEQKKLDAKKEENHTTQTELDERIKLLNKVAEETRQRTVEK